MNILYLVFDTCTSPIVESQVVEMCKRILLVNKKIHATLITVENKAEEIIRLENFIQKSVKGRKNFLITYFRYTLKIIKEAYLKKYEVIHVRSYLPMPIALVIKKIFKMKIIFDMRGLLPEEHIYLNDKTPKSITYRILKKLEKCSIKNSEVIVVVSYNFKQYLEQKYNCSDKIEVIYCSAKRNDSSDKEQYEKFLEKYNLNKEQIFVAYVGSFYKYQKVDQVFKSLYNIKKHNNIKILIFTKEEESYVKKLSIEKGFELDDLRVDYIPSNQLNKYLKYCDYGIINRDDSIINKVSSPIKVSEYIINDMNIIYRGCIGDFNQLFKKNNVGIDLDEISEKEIIKIKKNENIYPDELKSLVSFEYNFNKYLQIYKSV